MNLYERYLNGETITVHNDISKLGASAFNDSHREDVEKVLEETFKRVSINLEIIYNELIDFGYLFKTDYKFNFEKPLHPPLENTEYLIKKLDLTVENFGYIPLSLKYFYRIVGGVNFVWDFETNKKLMWNMADPIQVSSLDSIVEEVTNEYWEEDMLQYLDDEDFECAFLDISSDDLHKDNISGGQSYAIEITKEQSIDAKLINEPSNTTFINYLRICFENCGFPGITKFNNDYKAFFNQVKPQLKKI